MSVNVTPITIAGSGGAAAGGASFADTFNRASGNLGSNWVRVLCERTPFLAPQGFEVYRIGAAIDVINSLLIGGGGPGAGYSQITDSFAIPFQKFTALTGKTQFTQITFVAENPASTGNYVGPSVLSDPSDTTTPGSLHYYILAIQNGVFRLARFAGGVESLLVGALGGAVNGDVFRISADMSVAGQVTVVAKKNGIVIATVVDNTANRLSTGMPGVAAPSVGSGAGIGTVQWRNFSCGLGV